MSCKGCGQKSSRYDNMVKMSGDKDNPEMMEVRVNNSPGFQGEETVVLPTPPSKANLPSPEEASSFYDSFFSRKSMTYEEMTEKRLFQKDMSISQAEIFIKAMSPAMRQVHVDELIDVVNCERMSVPGMTPEQALSSLYDVIFSEEFSFVDTLYPGLKDEVRKRIEERNKVKNLPTRKKD